MREAIEAHERQMAEIPAQSERNLAKLEEQYKTLKEQIRTRHETKWKALADRWRDGMQHVASELAEVGRAVDEIGPPGTIPPGPTGRFPARSPRCVRFGTIALDSRRCPGASRPTPGSMEGLARRFELPAAAAVPGRRQPAHRDPDRGPDRGHRGAPGLDVPAPDQPAAGHGPVHDRRPDRHRPQLRRVHAPGRLRPGPRHEPGLDRPPPDRGAAGRARAPHGDRHPEVPAERVRHDRGLQRRGRRGRRALSRARGRRLPHQVRREVGRPPGRHRRRRRALRRAHARGRRHLEDAAAGLRHSTTCAPTAPT